jgi:hypothetical protein
MQSGLNSPDRLLVKYVYILTSIDEPERHYTGVTGDLKTASGRAFAKKRL